MNRLMAGFEGSLVADALAMPVHWYYDCEALARDYGPVDRFLAPKNPHPGSILWRSRYESLNERGDILREQAVFWGKRDIHYHQFLEAGENTLNFKLARELLLSGGTKPISLNVTSSIWRIIERIYRPDCLCICLD